jgi:hypothetical protein
MVALWIIYAFRLVWDLNIENIAGADIALLFFTLTCVFPSAAVATSLSFWNDEDIARYLLVTGVIICIGTLWLKDTFFLEGQLAVEMTGRLQLAKLNPITVGHVAGTTTLASIVLLTSKREKLWRIFALPAAGIALYLIILAASRGPIIAMGSCVLFLIVVRRMWLYAVLIAGTLFLAIAIYAVIDVNALLEQTRLAGTGYDDSSEERYVLLEIALQEIRNNWIFGSSYTLPFGQGWPHNIMVESWMAMGFFGFLLLVVLCLRGMAAAIASVTSDRPMMAFLFLQFFLAGQFSGALYGGWPGLWLGLAALLSQRFLRACVTGADAKIRLMPQIRSWTAPKIPPSQQP